ncbi:MAG: glycoside hydrolase family 2 protein [Candidatus Cyclobacteriaceae bacterium M3_2C_046]
MRNFSLIVLIILINWGQSIAQTTEFQYLSGTDKDHTVDWEFYCTDGMNSGQWTTIPVPSQWELQGFGHYNYGREKPEKHSSEKGMYRYEFSVPEAWENKKINIVFEGSMTDTEVRINGKSAGPIHQGSFYRFKYDISDLLRYNEQNLLEVTVSKQSANQSVNEAERQADYWIFGGIFRPVYLEALPAENIERIAIDALQSGDFHMDVYLDNIRRADQVEAQIVTLEDKPVGSKFQQPLNRGDTHITLIQKLDNPTPWNPEFPHLYKVKVALLNNGEVVHEVEDKFGFRTVELRPGNGIYVNGEKVIFKGVNRHSFWPTSGRTTSKALSIQDVQLIKDMNMNSVRMSHYPPDVHFLDVCDSLGLFVLDELAGWQDAYDTEVGRKLVREMIIRDVNHPSIVVWDNGNEGGNNFELDDDFHLYDPQKRPLIHPWAIFRNTDTQHYKDYNCCTGTLFHGREVFFPTEFLHGLFDGGHGAGLDDYWNLMLENPLGAGGFLWVFADEGVVRTDLDGKVDVFGSNAPDGIVGPYREKEGSFYTIREIWSPVYIKQNHLTPYFDGQLELENRYLYTNLDQCEFEWELVNFPRPEAQSNGHLVENQGNSQPPSIAPGEKGMLNLGLPDNWNNYDALYVRATDPHGREIYQWTWPIKDQKAMAQALLESTSAKASGKEEGDQIILSANGVEVSISKNSGTISRVVNQDGPVSFKNGPVLAHDSTTFQSIRHFPQGNDYLVQVELDGDMKKLEYRMLGNGWLQLDYDYISTGYHDYLGINFDYPEEKVTGVKWLGKGPYRVWKNRLKGTEYNVWQKDYNNTVTGESWLYPEFKGYHADLYWAVIENEESPFTIVSADPDLYLRLFTPAEPEGAYNENTEPPFPSGSISLMHGISPIGTKFKKAEQLGPQGKKNIFFTSGKPRNSLSGTLYFKFGH